MMNIMNILCLSETSQKKHKMEHLLFTTKPTVKPHFKLFATTYRKNRVAQKSTTSPIRKGEQ